MQDETTTGAGPSQPIAAHQQVSLASAVEQITSTSNPQSLARWLTKFAPKEVRETLLASLLPGDQDPLDILDVETNTLGVVWILSARLTASTAAPVSFDHISRFCATFDPEQARVAPERVTMLARGIFRYASGVNDNGAKLAIKPLYDLLTRYAPDLSYLTTVHPIFLHACTLANHFPPALLLPVLSVPISNVSLELSDLSYTDSLVYHYLGGCAWARMKRWKDARDFFELCIGAPGTAASAIQWEAVKKLVLVQCISTGKSTPLPKYAHPALTRLLKNSPYGAFAKHYPAQRDALASLVEKERAVFVDDNNLGLVNQALDRVPRWLIRGLTHTYLSLSLADIAKAVRLDVERARDTVVSMIDEDVITATLSAEGTVTFADAPVRVSKAEIDRILLGAQQQGLLLTKLDRALAGSREYLTKVTCLLTLCLSSPPPPLSFYSSSLARSLSVSILLR
ncbi:hypothetical protein PUNSTDRAFT_67669 [Punctularia strigosozonata HHB-11173 SS5]|uniref:uncharacterized protein n=1 Tax=Punctularia strigosozonata (strain HHB-11173) TaxID=741275 RepID=UPI0004418393|nr:uncharacterized protein PUNSTDRAFT_67669 [Punctularia strigosozonata HHB-11173 SS5]EIN09351.1 hypothetical protein PUNSTDRAFT_67669 [Punctularia strigosozonata HHB-11173 SS5]